VGKAPCDVNYVSSLALYYHYNYPPFYLTLRITVIYC
jgi:hypothetical protein